jgi:4-hydroxy-tetrahydrodipicolinate synthase
MQKENKVKSLSGIYSALVTPFLPSGDIDFVSLTRLIEGQKHSGIHGILIAGSTGEASSLNLAERKELVGLAKKQAGSMTVIAGAGSNNTKDAIALQKAMEEAHADMTLHVTPYYNKPTQAGMYEHFKVLANEAQIPIILYNNSARTNVDLSLTTIMRLAEECPNIVGIKDTNPDMARLSELIIFKQNCRSDWAIFSGDDSLNYPYLTLGADGAIAVVSQVAPKQMLDLFYAFKENRLLEAQKLGHELHQLIKALSSYVNPIPIKTLLAELKIINKVFRLPLCPLTKDEEQTFINICLNSPLITSYKQHGL